MKREAVSDGKPKRQGKGADLIRFLVAGVLNTLLTLAFYQMLLFVVSPQWAYGLSWFAGIAFVMIVYPSKVFIGSRSSILDQAALGLSYVVVFSIGAVMLEIMTRLSVNARLAIIFVIVATTASNFLLARFLLRRRHL